MKINGFLKTTLLDYPGKVACTIFCGACNFRCPYCQNGDLVLHHADLPAYSEEEIFSHLQKRSAILDGVCVTGGEATLQPDLPEFLSKVKNLGLLVKLDTNGYRPDILKNLIQQKLVDYVAMDIKHAPQKYNMICNVPNFSLEPIQESISFLINGTLPHEFRTTVVREFHTAEDLIAIAHWIKGTDAYFLQSYRDSEAVLQKGYHAYSPTEMESLLTQVQDILPQTSLRGTM